MKKSCFVNLYPFEIFNLSRFILLLLIFIIGNQYGQAQSQPTMPNNVPPSPTAAALGQYGEIPVGYYTGLPDISIPLYNISQDGIEIPITINYQYAGLRYLDKATFVGLGWSLSMGVITREVKSVDDLSMGKGYYQTDPSKLAIGNGFDIEPDIFYYNFNGHTGKFIMGYLDGIKPSIEFLNGMEDIKIELDPSKNFKVTTADGVIYYFNQKEISNVQRLPDGTAIDRISAWYLTSIELLNHEQISMNYSVSSKSILDESYQSYREEDPSKQPPISVVESKTVTKTDEVCPSTISWKDGQINFVFSHDGTTQLISMQVSTKGARLHKFSFGYDFFLQEGTNSKARLKLIWLKETGRDNSPAKTYSFYYNAGTMPQYPNAWLIPYGFYEKAPLTALLNKIVYPTGGNTEFIYGNHDYTEWPVTNPAMKHTSDKLGVRINRIINKDADGSILLDRNYEYKKKDVSGNLVSSGKLLSLAWFNFSPPGEPSKKIVYANSVVPLGGSGIVVGYDQVTVKDKLANGDNGKTEYYFSNNMDVYTAILPGLPGTSDPTNGTLTKEIKYKWDVLSSTYKTILENNYIDYDYLDKKEEPAIGSTYKGGNYKLKVMRSRIKQMEEKSYEEDGIVNSTTLYSYNSNYLQPEVLNISKSNGQTEQTIKRYCYNLPSSGVPAKMVSRHMLSPVLEEEYLINGVQQYITQNNYKELESNRVSLIVPNKINTRKKGNLSAEDRILYGEYNVNGNLLGFKMNSGPEHAYRWGYKDQYPIVSIVNAYNHSYFSYEPISTNESINLKSGSSSKNFTTAFPGNITLTISGNPGASYSLKYTLLGPKSTSGILCASRTSATCFYPGSIIIANAPAGDYKLEVSTYDGTSDYKEITFDYVISTIEVHTKEEFYYEGFEENTASNVITEGGYTGHNYSVNNIVNWAPLASGRNYVISYWYLINGKWNFSGLKPYTSSSYTMQTASGYDEIRIHPIDAQMTTYTYDPLVGMTSLTDPTGKTTFYEYDAFQRLKATKDLEGNIIQTYDYHYKQP